VVNVAPGLNFAANFVACNIDFLLSAVACGPFNPRLCSG
jgi:hypothetical protein